MGANSKIEWTDHTFNPWRGCEKVSAGCANCYAERQSKRNPSVLGIWGYHGTRVVASEAYWRQPLAWDRAAETAMERHRVFCASLADVFEDRADLFEPRWRLAHTIGVTPNLDWLLLTKRPENIMRLWYEMLMPQGVPRDLKPLHNIWFGTSVEDQSAADDRVAELVRVPAVIRFLSCEPLLGPVYLELRHGCRGCNHKGNIMPAWNEHGRCSVCDGTGQEPSGIHWVIIGAESGPKARPMDAGWARSLVQECRAAGVPVFVKQLCERGKKIPFEQWPADLQVREFPISFDPSAVAVPEDAT